MTMKISNPDDFISIDSFRCVWRADEHACCRFTARLHQGSGSKFPGPGSSCEMSDDDGFRFKGTITELEYTPVFDHDKITVTVKSSAIKNDAERRFRIYQGRKMRLPDVIKNAQPKNIKCEPDDEIVDGLVIVQDHETDWQFALRMAREHGHHIFVDTDDTDAAAIRDPEGSASIKNEDIVYMKLSQRERGSECVCRLAESVKLKLGQKVSIDGVSREMYVDEVVYEVRHAVYVYEYHLAEIEKKEDIHIPTSRYHLSAKVKDNKDTNRMGRVQLEYEGSIGRRDEDRIEDPMKDDPIWTDHAQLWASKGLGIVCVPMKDDIVSVEITDGKPRVVSVIRTEEFDKRADGPEKTRYIVFGDHTHIAADDETLVIDNGRYKCEITQGGLKIDCGGSTSLSVEEKQIQVKTGDMDLELSKKVQVDADTFAVSSTNAKISSRQKVHIKGTGGVSIG